ncbi:CCR4-NOT transcription complex subunit 9 [Medicago truncatula]|uniref:CCR4-NOT transcription complex subunit 9 n=1 Tax=Medicago truncatula TaxID=3880 RepID=UPI001967FFC4|nr:CCR4-NOT transcription complex subunit 9 [Medicago truncatula]
MASMERLVIELSNPDLRENALRVLSKKMTSFQELAPLLWNSFGTITILVQEIISIYPTLSSENLTPTQSTRMCDVLALLMCVASHPTTKMSFLNANMHLYLYPFLQTTSELTQYEWLRLGSLGVIGALVKVNTKEVMSFLLPNEIIPLCLGCMENDKEPSKSVGTFIIQKMLLDNAGLAYVCDTAEQFFTVARVFDMMLSSLKNQHSPRLLKLIIRCYSRLSEHSRARDALTSCLPNMLKDFNFINCLYEDSTTWRCIKKLYENLGMNQASLVPSG